MMMLSEDYLVWIWCCCCSQIAELIPKFICIFEAAFSTACYKWILHAGRISVRSKNQVSKQGFGADPIFWSASGIAPSSASGSVAPGADHSHFQERSGSDAWINFTFGRAPASNPWSKLSFFRNDIQIAMLIFLSFFVLFLSILRLIFGHHIPAIFQQFSCANENPHVI